MSQVFTTSDPYAHGGTRVRDMGFEEHYLKELNEQIAMLINAMVSGSAKDFADYRYMAGQYRGLSVAKTRYEEMLQSQECNL